MEDSKKLDERLEMLKAQADDGYIALRIIPRAEGKREFLKYEINKLIDNMTTNEIEILVNRLLK